MLDRREFCPYTERLEDHIGWLILLIIVLSSTAIWPVARWALQDNGEPSVVGFWVASTVAVACTLASLLSGDWRGAPVGVWLAGIAMGFAYAVGFWICINRALQIGPSGPTVTINNMAMVAGVLYSMLVLAPGRVTVWSVTGLVGVCAALLMLGLGRPAQDGAHHSAGARWARLVTLGGLLSGLSFVTQTYTGTLFPAHKYVYLAVGFGVAALLLLSLMLRQPSRFRLRRERTGGLVLGVANAITLPLSLIAIQMVGAEVALPVSVATPILLMLIVGRVFYRERLSAVAWVACVLGALSVALLAYANQG